MIHVLAIPALNRPDLLRRHLASIDEPVERLFVIDNSPDGSMGEAATELGVEVVDVGCNLGVAASWNLAMQINPRAPWWMLANVDQEYGPGDLGRVTAAMADPEARVACLCRFGAFGINRACLERVGWFDENFHPIYAEDADYEHRCLLAGVPVVDLPSATVQLDGGSVSWRSDPAYATANARTYPANLAYYEAKWGGPLRGGERFATPFNAGGLVAEWTLDPARLREQAWS
jgi:GT2 family glycosyltransferase